MLPRDGVRRECELVEELGIVCFDGGPGFTSMLVEDCVYCGNVALFV